MDVILLRFDAPLVSYGGVCVDAHGVTMPFPGRSMLAGLLGNALGFTHRDAAALSSLQARIEYAARADRPGELLVDYQTTDLGQTDAHDVQWLQTGNWTTHGRVEVRGGGRAKTGTDIRLRHYLADSCSTLALTLRDEQTGEPSSGEVAAALDKPARPLFIGRKCCLPARPILLGRRDGRGLRDALESAPLADGAHHQMRAWWPLAEGFDPNKHRRVGLVDERDWHNQVHTGRRWMVEGTMGTEKPS